MGVLNITPDSFSDGGKFIDPQIALQHAKQMVADGADIIDIGGESTRPYSDPVSAEEECKRVIPVIEALSDTIDVPISIDTTKAAVARQAVSAGASIINDIGALQLDPNMAETVANLDVPVILMHMKGTPKTMQSDPFYNNLIEEIIAFLENAIEYAVKNNISRDKIIVDPGIGFGKTFGHNLSVIKHVERFQTLNTPLLVGPSRKAFVRHLVKEESDKDIDPMRAIVETGTQAAISAAVLNGAHIVRVHDVAQTKATLKVVDAIKAAV